MSSEDTAHRKRNNYKLIVDPELQKGKKKLYRINGAIPGVSGCSSIRTVLINKLTDPQPHLIIIIWVCVSEL